ncbi:thiamine pyrophosphate-dependent dehydrogenase E1 component subunit alpha [Texcoconibacillus texcoconensis]|uniref:2-oxoisovalerate dehydrogenase subunit alpha n=1 Tax=Texcoconibacillus texcoconensis TaxID=1095777 RepID=A0A840QNU0_9BACI|nr:thiamine pyrophosphate-dependent dehydrogenase E1 component subunit alpha [Texcoconibacillus texcoconensis]MBB5173045.1 2-oxoisovalerate dehydrogenase E1 component alpha subunit [Texcoconibacillus texcoconensis]
MRNADYKTAGLSETQLLEMYETILLTRRIDERLWLLNRAGKIPFVVSCQGQEAAQVGAAMALDQSKDYVLPYYRDMGVVLTFGMTAKDLMLSSFAKAEDPNSGGRQMPGHFGQKKNRIVTGSSPVTTQVPHAVGIALGGQLEGKDFVSFTTFGEGSSNQGDFHEGINFASVHNLPVIFMCENNKYAISMSQDQQLNIESVADRAAGYGIIGETVDGNDPIAVYHAVKKAADRARKGEGPTLIETVSYRLTPHSSDDDDRTYREREEVEEAKKNDALVTFVDHLRSLDVLTNDIEESIEQKIRELVDEATDYAENASDPDPTTLRDHVYKEEGS